MRQRKEVLTCTVLIAVVVLNLSGPASGVRTMTYFNLHTQPLSWNQAKRICEEKGAMLIEMESSAIEDMSEFFRENPPWSEATITTALRRTSLVNNLTDIWLGLVTTDPETASYSWSNSCLPLNVGDPGLDEVQTDGHTGSAYCVLDIDDNWTTRDCTEKHLFICQTNTDEPCVVKILENTTFSNTFMESGQLTALPEFGNPDRSICELTCSTEDMCWAAIFLGGKCYRYNVEKLSDVLHSENYQSAPDTDLIFIHCYTALVEVSTNLFVSSSPNDIIPDVTCPSNITRSAQETTMLSETTRTMSEIMATTDKITLLELTAGMADTVTVVPDMETTSVVAEAAATTTASITSSVVTLATGVSTTPDSETTTSKDVPSSAKIIVTSTPTAQSRTATTSILGPSTGTIPVDTTTSSGPVDVNTVAISHNLETSGATQTLKSLITTEQENFESTTKVEPLPSPAKDISSIATTPSESETPTTGDKNTMTSTPLGEVTSKPEEDCTCTCSEYRNFTAAEKAEFIEKLIKDLTMDKSNFSSEKRKYISVMDNRPSAQNVGIMGVILLCVVFGGLVMLDISALCRDLVKLKSNFLSAIGRR